MAETRVVSRMSRAALEDEVYGHRALDSSAVRRDLEKAVAQNRVLELRDRERARQIREMAAKLQAAERNAMRFHALLLQERVRHLPKDTP